MQICNSNWDLRRPVEEYKYNFQILDWCVEKRGGGIILTSLGETTRKRGGDHGERRSGPLFFSVGLALACFFFCIETKAWLAISSVPRIYIHTMPNIVPNQRTICHAWRSNVTVCVLYIYICVKVAKGGDGGNGCISLRRSRSDRRGKPDGENSPAALPVQSHIMKPACGNSSSLGCIGLFASLGSFSDSQFSYFADQPSSLSLTLDTFSIQIFWFCSIQPSNYLLAETYNIW